MKEAVLIDSASINGRERRAVGNARNGMPLLRPDGVGGTPGFDRTKPEALLHLPSYVLGGEYLFWEAEDIRQEESLPDETGVIRFRVSADTTVYLFLPHDLEAPEGFSFVEDRVMINRAYFPGGTSVYMKRLAAGSWTELPGQQPSYGQGQGASPGAGRLPPLIVVQERGSVFAEITVREDAADRLTQTAPGTDTVFEAGTNVILDAVVSPWQFSRRLPLRRRWFVEGEEGWIPLEGNSFELKDEESAFLRFRLELYTPDGQIEYRAEKTIGIVKR
jgi:hypothetical protein